MLFLHSQYFETGLELLSGGFLLGKTFSELGKLQDARMKRVIIIIIIIIITIIIILFSLYNIICWVSAIVRRIHSIVVNYCCVLYYSFVFDVYDEFNLIYSRTCSVFALRLSSSS